MPHRLAARTGFGPVERARRTAQRRAKVTTNTGNADAAADTQVPPEVNP